MTDPVVTFRMSEGDYAKLKDYADKNDLTVSQAIRRAIRWMQLLYGGSR